MIRLHEKGLSSSALTSFAVLLVVTSMALAFQDQNPEQDLKSAKQLEEQGNFAEAAEKLRSLLGNSEATGEQVAQATKSMHNCLRRLRQDDQIDSVLDLILERHGDQYLAVDAAADLLQSAVHYGVVADGSFTRGYSRGYSGRGGVAGRNVNVVETDRLKIIRLRLQAIDLAQADGLEAKSDVLARLQLKLGSTILFSRYNQQAWQLQALSDLSQEIDYADIDAQSNAPSRRAPVDKDGAPVLYALPDSWDTASSDGERYRWALAQASENGQVKNEAQLGWAEFLRSQFAVDTLSGAAWLARETSEEPETGIYAIHTLGENETIAKLASGVKRFELKEPFNFIAIYRSLAGQADQSSQRSSAIRQLVRIFENRRQYPKAAELIESNLDLFSQEKLDDIRKPRIAIDPIESQVAGSPVEFSLVFRNTSSLQFTARRVDIEKILGDVKQHFRQLSPNGRNNFGGKEGEPIPRLAFPYSLFDEPNIDDYLVGEPTDWSETVQSRENHWDRRQKFTAPFTDAGLYVLDVATEGEASKTRSLIWVQDTVLVRKPLDSKWLVLVADAKTGEPLPGANVEFFGWRNERSQNGRSASVVTRNFAEKTDDQGQAIAEFEDRFQWFTVARGTDGRLGLLDFARFWQQRYRQQNFSQTKAYGVTDRPVYKPNDPVKVKFWLSNTAYGQVRPLELTGQPFAFTVRDAKNNSIFETTLTTDQYGGCDFEFRLPEDATLGVYRFEVRGAGPNEGSKPYIGNQLIFRVEEYRKPEFEVEIDSPTAPVALGETVKARVKAKYYFGSPVTDAVVTVRVERSTFRDQYYPAAPYDWCYGPGYWWVYEDYNWYPGWGRWRGCIRPAPPWYPSWSSEQPELVLDQELQLDANGQAEFEIDTAVAKTLYGDEDHRYSITVEVRDASRRTITATGQVIVSQAAFKIYTWTNRGYYNVDDRIEANFQARTLDGSPVAAAGTLELMKIRYDDALQPIEQTVLTREVATNDQGRLTEQFAASAAGQYRIRLRLRDGQGREVEGAQIITVRGQGQAAGDFRFNALEITPDKPHYAVGDTVQLQLASNHENAFVALFIRPENSTYPEPRYIRLKGKSEVVELEVSDTDQPNFFVEAFTIFDGQLHQQAREIIVPPENRVLDVEVTTDKSEYEPGEQAQVQLSVKSPDGEPVRGSCLIAVYDRSLEQIAPDAIPQDIREFFWKWRRQHSPQYSSNVDFTSRPIGVADWITLKPLGIFGSSQADDFEALASDSAVTMQRYQVSGGMGGGAAMRGRSAGVMMDGAMPAPAAAAEAMEMKSMPTSGAMAEEGSPAIAIRKDFADAALWVANITTDQSGHATADFKMPENLTSWRIKAWSVAERTRVGSAEAEAVTRKPLLVRLITPRFLVERDQATLSAIVQNDLPTKQTVSVSLEIDGQTQLEIAGGQPSMQQVVIEPGAQARVDWPTNALAEGDVSIRAVAKCTAAADAVQLTLPIAVNGILKTDAYAGTVRKGEASSTVMLSIPEDRRVQQSQLTIRLSPSLAASMLDALPYLIHYPYGCTEQTLNRFVPTVVTQRVLKELGVNLADLQRRGNNLNAQELGEAADRRTQWQMGDNSPVFDENELNKMVRQGVGRLTDMQCSDGGWGWFSGAGERSSPHTTATVVRGLIVARDNGMPIVPDVLRRGLDWLQQYQNAELQKLQNAATKTMPYRTDVNNLDALVFHTLTLGGQANEQMQQRLYDGRDRLSVYGKALLAWATHHLDNSEQTEMLRRNIEQFLVEDRENETAFLRNDSSWWHWYGSEIEANAIYLKLLAALEPGGQTAPRLVKFLLNNRKNATYWNSTRDTALVVEAFGDYLRATGETAAASTVEVLLAGKRIGRVEFTPDNLFSVENSIRLVGNAVPAGTQELEIRRTGAGNLYWNVYSTNFTVEEEIAPAGLEVKVQRRYWALVAGERDLTLPGSDAEIVDTSRRALTRDALADLQDLPSGTMVEVELLVQSKNDYEYILIEDRKPATLEAVDTKSGYFYNAGLSIYREFRDKHVGLFVRRLPKGNYSIRYQLRSEAPGTFTALPATIQAMYAPELIGNSADFDIRVVDQQ